VMKRPTIYLDHAATTPVLPQVAQVVMEAFGQWANPSSQHAAGRKARAALEEARARVAKALDWDGEVIFTSGASEALALGWGRSQALRRLASGVEHAAVSRLAEGSVPVPVNALGLVECDALPAADLIAVQQVNNETGVIQHGAALGEAIHARGAVWLADCAQGAGKIALPPADMVAIAGHKFGAPVGVGALLVRSLGLLSPSGGQERGYRGGTENLPLILGLAEALEADRGWLADAATLRAWFEGEMRDLGAQIIAEGAERIPTIGGYRLPGRNATQVLIRADMAGIAISSGAACSSGSIKPSPTLLAMGYSEGEAREVFRVSIGRETQRCDLEALLDVLRKVAL
jgi:cysteine desulfurase